MAARMPPEQGKRMRTGNCRHIPPEIVEEILLNLPVKSLVRFSFVSKSWNSMISQLEFAKRYRSRAALPGRERMVISLSGGIDVNNAFSCPLSSISDHRIQVATEITCPIQGELFLHAFCDGLWCVEADNSLFLWNPSMRTYKKLPDPSIPAETLFCFVYGIGYDSVGDDYKILRFPRLNSDLVPLTELYSLKSNSWREIRPLPGYPLTGQEQSVFVNGILHWISSYLHSGESRIINTFDLSTEKFGEVAQPRYHPISEPSETVEVTVLRGMLCVCLNYRDRFVLWVMEDYGVGKSWTRKFDIQYGNNIPSEPRTQSPLRLTPLYFYDNGDILIKVSVIWSCYKTSEIFIHKIKEDTLQNIIGHDSYSNISDGFLYVESLISPATWPTAAPIARKSE